MVNAGWGGRWKNAAHRNGQNGQLVTLVGAGSLRRKRWPYHSLVVSTTCLLWFQKSTNCVRSCPENQIICKRHTYMATISDFQYLFWYSYSSIQPQKENSFHCCLTFQLILFSFPRKHINLWIFFIISLCWIFFLLKISKKNIYEGKFLRI